MPKIPVDPIAERHSSGCDNSDNMTYAYRTLNSNDGYARVILASDLETEA